MKSESEFNQRKLDQLLGKVYQYIKDFIKEYSIEKFYTYVIDDLNISGPEILRSSITPGSEFRKVGYSIGIFIVF